MAPGTPQGRHNLLRGVEQSCMRKAGQQRAESWDAAQGCPPGVLACLSACMCFLYCEPAINACGWRMQRTSSAGSRPRCPCWCTSRTCAVHRRQDDSQPCSWAFGPCAAQSANAARAKIRQNWMQWAGRGRSCL